MLDLFILNIIFRLVFDNCILFVVLESCCVVKMCIDILVVFIGCFLVFRLLDIFIGRFLFGRIMFLLMVCVFCFFGVRFIVL